ncbi:MAG: sensor domain-containing diguanylate cyclase [Hamadaea sp.]|nr:sensor domain-containing diguanylate cyclase [Hamadaea sp.]NUT19494.1 sensor domain-containing diguanylate cyclase [Hamadaea sp.]
MLTPPRITEDVTDRLRAAHSAVDACRAVVDVLATHTDALIATLLHVHDHLRCVAAAGSWHVFSSVPLGRGIVGRVYASGRTAVLTDVTTDPEFIRLGPDVVAEICVPIVDRAGQPLGALNLEWTSELAAAPDLDAWRVLAEELGRSLGARIDELGGPPAETQAEKLLRHSVSLSAAGTESEVYARAAEAARDVSGLSSAVVLTPAVADSPELADVPMGVAGSAALFIGGVVLRSSSPGPRDRALIQRLAELGGRELGVLLDRARRHGTSFTLGDPDRLDPRGFEAVTKAGVRTMIVAPIGPGALGGVLVAFDDVTAHPEPARVSLLELLGTQAWTCLDRLHSLTRLRHRASSDPLTGLRHHGPFGERLAAAEPGRTALLAIDVDQFKIINDTYGHAAGDRALVDLARSLESTLRQGDELYRIGGDEFVAVVEVPSVTEAVAVAERLTAAARRVGRTISVGVALQRRDELGETTLNRADQALYEVKRRGRDGVHLAP